MTTESSGCRAVASGAVADIGVFGFYWSASPSNASSGSYLRFYAGDVYPQTYNPRGNGFPLRCIREFALLGEYRWPDKAKVQEAGRVAIRNAENMGTTIECMTTVGSGYRNVASGAIVSVGISGYYWSASPYSATDGLHLYSRSDNVLPQYNGSRGSGYPLRCIREFTLHGENRWNGRRRKKVTQKT